MSKFSLNNVDRRAERGSTILEFAIVATIFFMVLISIFAGANVYFTHNALVDATRRGARYAATHGTSAADVTKVKNVVLYGTSSPAAGAQSFIPDLTDANVVVEYNGFGVMDGTASVSLKDYQYNLVIPGISRMIPMPAYRTTMRGESAGYAPPVAK
jgi:Flp pilus assembly protein TadG